jgi:glyoxylase-like metal-dependent hydrolase (beta-lactamase superfamily II)
MQVLGQKGEHLELLANFSVEVVTDRLFAENTYILWQPGERRCLVVDPGLEPAKIIELLRRQGLTPAAILNTHGHADHIAGNGPLKEAFPGVPLMIGAGDAPKLVDAWENLSAQYGIPITSPPADRLLREGDVVEEAGFRLEVRETPGHSSGHVVFVIRSAGEGPPVVLGGDVLFEGSIGRTDFPDGDHEALLRSIREKLFTLPGDTIVLPGHGDPTTTGEEQRTNPYLR